MTGRGVTAVVPVYNSGATMPALAAQLMAALRPFAPFEILLVNDGSRDESWTAIAKEMAAHPEIRGIDLSRNFGQHNALLCGIRQAQFPIVVTLDDDLQNPPEEIAKLLADLASGADVVYGTPMREAHGVVRDGASVLTKAVMRYLMGTPHARSVSAFRAFRTGLRDAFADYRGAQVNIDVLLSWGTTRFAAVPVRHEPRTVGRSNYNFRKLATHAINMITGFSAVPLRISTLIGFTFAIIGFGLLAFVGISYLVTGATVPGFAFLASMIAIFSGVQMAALGVIGEYLARMHFRLMDRPPYVVRS